MLAEKNTEAQTIQEWQLCLDELKSELPTAEYSLWVAPIQAELVDADCLSLACPGHRALQYVQNSQVYSYLRKSVNRHFGNQTKNFYPTERSQARTAKTPSKCAPRQA